jgi:hypothetical protein
VSQPESERLFDPDRLAALLSTGLLDSADNAEFDRLSELTRRVLRVPVALISRC